MMYHITVEEVDMKITLRTKNGATLTPFERKVVKLAVMFYANKLMTPRMVNSLDIAINVHSNYHKTTGYLGEVYPTDTDETSRPKQFEINLDWPKRFKQLLISLAHEMVHVKQYAKCELKFHERGNVVTFQKQQYSDDEYWESPWEIEAYGREPGLWQKFKPTYRLLLAENRIKD
jgi:hypothetical protein